MKDMKWIEIAEDEEKIIQVLKQETGHLNSYNYSRSM
jgi:hypothetical protein